MINGLMIDVDGVLICGRPSDGKPWASTIEHDLGVSVEILQREFFAPYWGDIVIGQADLIDHLEPILAKIAPHLSCDEFVAYWFSNDARLNLRLLREVDQQRKSGRMVFLATNQEHIRAKYLLDVLGLRNHCDDIFYSAALGCRKPDRSFFEKAGALSGFPPDQLLLLDDTHANLTTALASGWHAAHWSEGRSLSAIVAKTGL
ncbi:HAD-IA family hydrolase [uncultured Roseibium sp.]|uniref:HAD-IA family hydrolase n=1 Tax=uncultured Roseibium sp. TaxID=1936171 RepID=UPI0032172F99